MPIKFSLPHPFLEIEIDYFTDPSEPIFHNRTTLKITSKKSPLFDEFAQHLSKSKISSKCYRIVKHSECYILVKYPEVIFEILKGLNKFYQSKNIPSRLDEFINNLKLIYLGDEAKNIADKVLDIPVYPDVKYVVIACLDNNNNVAGTLQKGITKDNKGNQNYRYYHYKRQITDYYVIDGDHADLQINSFLDYAKKSPLLPSISPKIINQVSVYFGNTITPDLKYEFKLSNKPHIVIQFSPDNYLIISRLLEKIRVQYYNFFLKNAFVIKDHRKVINFLSFVLSKNNKLDFLGLRDRKSEIQQYINSHSYSRPYSKRSVNAALLEIDKQQPPLGKGVYSQVYLLSSNGRYAKKPKVFKYYKTDLKIAEIEAAITTCLHFVLGDIIPKMRPVYRNAEYLGSIATQIMGFKSLERYFTQTPSGIQVINEPEITAIINNQFSTCIRILVASYIRRQNDLHLGNVSVDDQGNLHIFDQNQAKFHKTCIYNNRDPAKGTFFRGKVFPAPQDAFPFTETDIRNFPFVKDYKAMNWLPDYFKLLNIDYSQCDTIKYKWFLHNLLVPTKNNDGAFTLNISMEKVAQEYALDDKDAISKIQSLLVNMPEFQDCILSHPEFIDELIVEFNKANLSYKANKFPELIININTVKQIYTDIVRELYLHKLIRLLKANNESEVLLLLDAMFKTIEIYNISLIISHVESLIKDNNFLKITFYGNMILYLSNKSAVSPEYCNLIEHFYLKKFESAIRSGNFVPVLLEILTHINSYNMSPILSKIESLVADDPKSEMIFCEKMVEYHYSRNELDQVQKYLGKISNHNFHKSINVLHKIAAQQRDSKMKVVDNQSQIFSLATSNFTKKRVPDSKKKVDDIEERKLFELKCEKNEILDFLKELRKWEKEVKLLIENRKNKDNFFGKLSLFFHSSKVLPEKEVGLAWDQLKIISSLKIALVTFMSGDEFNYTTMNKWREKIASTYNSKQAQALKEDLSISVKINLKAIIELNMPTAALNSAQNGGIYAN